MHNVSALSQSPVYKATLPNILFNFNITITFKLRRFSMQRFHQLLLTIKLIQENLEKCNVNAGKSKHLTIHDHIRFQL